MTRDEPIGLGAVENSFGEWSIPDFTVGGTPGQYKRASLELKDNKLVGLTFIYYSAWFDDVAAAVKAKYPSAKCRNEVLQNRFGARFINTTCVVEDRRSRLAIERMFDGESGSLSLRARSPQGSQSEEARKRKADI